MITVKELYQIGEQSRDKRQKKIKKVLSEIESLCIEKEILSKFGQERTITYTFDYNSTMSLIDDIQDELHKKGFKTKIYEPHHNVLFISWSF